MCPILVGYSEALPTCDLAKGHNSSARVRVPRCVYCSSSNILPEFLSDCKNAPLKADMPANGTLYKISVVSDR